MGTEKIDASLLAKMFLAGANNLEAKKEWINELNVFPVPDGDTGTNFSLYKNLEKLDAYVYRRILYCNENTIVANGGKTIREHSDGYPIPIQKF